MFAVIIAEPVAQDIVPMWALSGERTNPNRFDTIWKMLANLISALAILTNCTAVVSVPSLATGERRPVHVTGQIQARYWSLPLDKTQPRSLTYCIHDGSGGAYVISPTNTSLQTGDWIDVRGDLCFVDYTGNCIIPAELRLLRHDKLQPLPCGEPLQIRSGAHDFRNVTFTGTVIDAFPDELDPNWKWLLVSKNSTVVSLAVNDRESTDDDLNALIGCEISATGLCAPNTGRRRFVGSRLRVTEFGKINVLQRESDAIFDAPQLNPVAPIHEFSRARVDGRVIALWDANRAFISTGDGHAVEVRFRSGRALPAVGTHVRVVGFVEADIFYSRLSQAVWKAADAPRPPPLAVQSVVPKRLLENATASRRIESDFNGRLIHLTGTVQGRPSEVSGRVVIQLSCDGYLIPLDVTSASEAATAVEPGSTLSVVGVCLMEFDAQTRIANLPRIKGFSLIVRSPADLTVLSTPPWWTVTKLLHVIFFLVLILAAILVWNLSLRRIAERRGRELFRENVARISADLRTEERTRLAVDLHDSLAQMLTGVSLQIDAGEYEIASKSLKSCRDELRNCLWDLRNQTLEERDMGEAIRRTLKPHIGTAQLLVRFNVPRAKLSDSTAHSVLMIVRELATNAVRHGHAKTIRVAGGLDADELRFSVRDDGCGFDPDRCLGMAEGHFGLQGIRERVKRCDGTIAIESALGKGTRVTISLKRQK